MPNLSFLSPSQPSERRSGTRTRESKSVRLRVRSQQNHHRLQRKLCSIHYEDLQFCQILQQWTWEWRQWKIAAEERGEWTLWTCGERMFMMHYDLMCLCEDIIVSFRENSNVVSSCVVQRGLPFVLRCWYFIIMKLSITFKSIPVSVIHTVIYCKTLPNPQKMLK